MPPEPPAPPADAPPDPVLTDDEASRRLAYLRFDAGDEERLCSVHGLATEYAQPVIEAFYGHLLAFPDTAAYFEDPALLDHVKRKQVEYFLRLTEGGYDRAYMENRLRVGSAHERIGLGIDQYLGSYAFYLSEVAGRLQEAFPSDSGRAFSTFFSLIKVVLLDISLATETYIRERERTIGQRERTIGVQASLLELAHDAILVRSRDARALFWNRGAERAYGWSAAEAVGRSCDDLLETRYPQAPAMIMEQLLRTGFWEGELVQICRDGRVVVVESRWAATTEYRGDAFAILEIDRDVTERIAVDRALKRSHQELVRATRARDEFLARASHELRTPLNAIIGFAHLMGMEPDEPTRAEFSQKVVRAGRRLLDVVESVLDLAAAQSGRLEMSMEAVPVDRLIAEAVALMEDSAAEQGVSIATRIPVPGSVVLADPQRLAQVLVTLLSNAVRYNRRGGRVTVTVRRRAERIVVAVADTGSGIRGEDVGRLFEPFQRLGPEPDAGDGIGLRLALSRDLVTAMGGTLRVRTRPGTGSVFSITLPAGGGGATVRAATSRGTGPSRSRSRGRSGPRAAPPSRPPPPSR